MSLGDDALLGEDSALDRLAAVLPVLGEDFPPAVTADLPPGPAPAGDDPHPAAVRPRGRRRSGPGAGARRPSGVAGPAGAGRGDAPGTTRSRSDATAPALSWRALVVLLVAVYVATVAVDVGIMVWQQASAPEPGKINVDGPLACPMYRVNRAGQAEPDGACFFVG